MKDSNQRSRRALAALVIGFGLLLAACSGAPASAAEPPAPTQAAPVEAASPTDAPAPADAPAPVDAASPTTAADAAAPTAESALPPAPAASTGAGLACMGSSDRGVACWDGSAWRQYDADSGLTSNWVTALVPCGDRILALGGTDLNLFDGAAWSALAGNWDYNTLNSAACDAQGGIWVSYYGGLSYYDGSAWTATAAADLATGDSATQQVDDVAVAPDGTVWVQTSNSIAAYQNGQWTLYQQGSGFEQVMYFSGLALDGQGRPWATTGDAVLSFDGAAWQSTPINDYLTVEAFTVDPAGRVYVGSYDQGLYVLENQAWTNVNAASGALGSDHVRAVASDAAGRVWVATTYGLSVSDGGAWKQYRMDNSDLHDNDLTTLLLRGDPALPVEAPKAAGSITGALVNSDGSPMVGAAVEICVEDPLFFDATPCTGQPFVRQTTTGADGSFSVTDLPTGLYVVAANLGDSWATLTDSYGFTSQRVLIEPGAEKNLGSLQKTDD